jgi:hypothetical protein
LPGYYGNFFERCNFWVGAEKCNFSTFLKATPLKKFATTKSVDYNIAVLDYGTQGQFKAQINNLLEFALTVDDFSFYN